MKFLKKSKKLIIGIIIGLIVGSVVSVYAAYSYFAEDVSYASSNGTEISVQEALDQLYARQNLGTMSTNYTGYYADVNDDGTVDGVIFIDLEQGASGQWYDSTGIYAFLPAGNLRSYKISTKTSSYSGKFGTKQVIVPNGTSGNARFYVMALSDFDKNSYKWSDACKKTQTVENVTFRLPSKEEWSAFGGQFGITKENYSSTYGLSNVYWSSAGYVGSYGWDANFYCGYMFNNSTTDNYLVRLCATF